MFKFSQSKWNHIYSQSKPYTKATLLELQQILKVLLAHKNLFILVFMQIYTVYVFPKSPPNPFSVFFTLWLNFGMTKRKKKKKSIRTLTILERNLISLSALACALHYIHHACSEAVLSFLQDNFFMNIWVLNRTHTNQLADVLSKSLRGSH